ncbi:MAG: DUF3343 domain-containing protein [Coriobacteriia bacterium]|nr:DUF3343 domain-containing protein [Coriobacteriia bacterium]
MGLFGRKKKKREVQEGAGEAVGIFLFDAVPDALRAEAVLRRAGYDIELVAPPMHLRAGCDLAVAVASVEQPGAERVLASHDAMARGWADTLDGSLAITDVVTYEDFGDWLMVRAGNMKITVEKATGRIVNTSGGGCPDIPYLNLEFVGTVLDHERRPRDLGYTLCGLMLDRAYVEAREMLASPGETGSAGEGAA